MAKKISISPTSSSLYSFGDSCLDLFFHVKPLRHPLEDNTIQQQADYNHFALNYLKQQLPVAWSHSPPITLKLIFNNHPKTLLFNLPSLTSQDAVERLHHDPDYKLLHDRVMDLLAEGLKSDIDLLKQQHKLELKPDEDGDELDADLMVPGAAAFVINEISDHLSGAILLHESIARRLFPPESDQSEEWERLRKALVPLTNYYNHRIMYLNPTQEVSVVKKCLEEVKAAAEGGSNLRGGNGIIKLDALLPNEIIKYVEDEDFGEAAELQWKAVLGKFKNCLAVCNITTDCMAIPVIELAVCFGLVLSELITDPAWKGKVISFGHLPDQPLLHLIQGDDLKSMHEFMMRTCFRESNEGVDLRKVFDLILEVVVNENLKAEQIIKKAFVFTDFKGFFSCTSTMPHILLWNVCDWKFPHSKEHHPGVTMVSGFSDNLIKSFLDNGGEIGPQALMEASIADKEYQTFSVVD
ncbi:hypothetical protein PRUPE_5G194100 [Prunus persica]|uniref:Uncharacterized protein n=1 Tax=Prunus persica TaxID=3760 RepID=M5WEM3_PRUPE|nr:hypothetical protein PRUPE_5G194100 [Prunus persica]